MRGDLKRAFKAKTFFKLIYNRHVNLMFSKSGKLLLLSAGNGSEMAVQSLRPTD